MFRNFRHKKYFIGNGRATRSEFWAVIIGSAILSAIAVYVIAVVGSLAASAFDSLFGESWEQTWLVLPIFFLYVVSILAIAALLLLQIWLAIAACVRRLHDCDFPGWPALLFFVPYVGAFMLLVLGLWFPHEPNRYGDDPRQFRKAYDA